MAIERRSEKREAVLSLLRSVKCHPSAEWVHARLRETYPGLSLGTVYRNLRQLTEEGLVRSVGVIDGQERFDGNVSPHCHFVCSKCGAVTDVELPVGAGAAKSAEKLTGGRVDGVEVRFTGLCAGCKQEDIQV